MAVVRQVTEAGAEHLKLFVGRARDLEVLSAIGRRRDAVGGASDDEVRNREGANPLTDSWRAAEEALGTTRPVPPQYQFGMGGD